MKRFFYAMITTGRPAFHGRRNWKTGEVSHYFRVRAFTSRLKRNAWAKDQPYSYPMHADWQPATVAMIRREHRGLTGKEFATYMELVRQFELVSD